MSQQSNINITGMRAFILLCIGQTVSLLGTNLAGFALGFWVLEKSGSVMNLALVFTLMALPGIFIAPIAGVWVDRWDKRWIMILGDSCAAMSTLIVTWLLFVGQLSIWHVYLLTILNALADTFQRPAFAAIMPVLVPKEQMGRANGIVQAVLAVSQILAPLLAGILVVSIQVQGVLLIDFLTFLVAIFVTIIIRVPKITHTAETQKPKGSMWEEMMYGWNYLVSRKGLLGLLVLYTLVNFLYAAADVLIMPLALSVTSTTILGSIMSVGGIAMLLGSLLMGIWGGPKRRVFGVIGFMALGGFAIALGGSRPSVPFFFIAAFVFFFAFPIINACTQAIFQLKVAPNVQGRVFSLRGMAVSLALLLAYLTVGPLADFAFEPWLAEGGALSSSIGILIGVGPGRGIGLMFVVAGLVSMVVALAGLFYPRLRNLDIELPDMLPASPVPQAENAESVEPAQPISMANAK
jgi:MFS family permease